jgi:pimeloyl-ACP methyl ester carboxylesterase
MHNCDCTGIQSDQWLEASMTSGDIPSAKHMAVKMQEMELGQGEPLVLVPGGLTGWLSWEPHAARLSARKRVIRVQLLSVQYGLESKPLPAEYSVKMESQALAATLDDLKLTGPLDLVAWSFGGEVTLNYALDNPSRVRSLVLIEPPAYWVLRASGNLDAEAIQNQDTLLTLQGIISEEQLEKFALTVGLVPPGQSPRKLPQWPLWMQHRQSLANSPAVIEHDDSLSRVRSFRKPVLLVKGTGSAKFLHQIIEVLFSELPHSRVIEIPAGHAPQIVSMDSFLEEMDRFQRSVD